MLIGRISNYEFTIKDYKYIFGISFLIFMLYLFLAKYDEIQSKSNTLASKSFTETAPNPQLPYEEYQDLLAGKNLSVEIDERTSHILDQSYDENIQYLSDLHVSTTNELTGVTVFKEELINTQNFNTSIFTF